MSNTPNYTFSSVKRTSEFAHRACQSSRNTATAYRELLNIEIPNKQSKCVSEIDWSIPPQPFEPVMFDSKPAKKVPLHALKKQTTVERVSSIDFKQNMDKQQRDMFQENVNRQQLEYAQNLNDKFKQKDSVKHKKLVQQYSEEITALTRENIDISQDIEVLEVKLAQTQNAVAAIRAQMDQEQILLHKTREQLETFEQLEDLDKVYEEFAYINPQEIIDQISSLEQNFVQQTLQDQQAEALLQEEQQSQISTKLLQKHKQDQADKHALESQLYWTQKISQLRSENQKLASDTAQAEQAAVKSVQIREAIDQFVNNWRQVLDYNFVHEIPQINSLQALTQVQNVIFRAKNQQYIKTPAGELHRKLSKLCLKFQAEFAHQENIKQDVPRIAQVVAESALKVKQEIERVQSKCVTLLEETKKVSQVREEVLQWMVKTKMQIE
ncbi:Conserved_hypothetical protein [Hexamita inflata]|uniref:Uncharacterized protein n=1 Tax=Hexamita inflata TaxID=28002 RepID=A0AA86QJ71_9EUKA|nr:Conserved hypothetical protein [Hexamita inflata]